LQTCLVSALSIFLGRDDACLYGADFRIIPILIETRASTTCGERRRSRWSSSLVRFAAAVSRPRTPHLHSCPNP